MSPTVPIIDVAGLRAAEPDARRAVAAELANDPTQEQYQLWILDPNRDSKPVDGGVFDIDQAGEVVLPIHAKLKVDDPTLFAITIEKPGGVVVSDQSRLPLLAVVSAR